MSVIPVKAPAVEISQSEVLTEPVVMPLPRVKTPETEAVVASRSVTWVEAPLNFHSPVIVSLAALEAGPLVQSNLTKDREAVLVRLNILGSKDREPT
jgi:hypothetical protein